MHELRPKWAIWGIYQNGQFWLQSVVKVGSEGEIKKSKTLKRLTLDGSKTLFLRICEIFSQFCKTWNSGKKFSATCTGYGPKSFAKLLRALKWSQHTSRLIIRWLYAIYHHTNCHHQTSILYCTICTVEAHISPNLGTISRYLDKPWICFYLFFY